MLDSPEVIGRVESSITTHDPVDSFLYDVATMGRPDSQDLDDRAQKLLATASEIVKSYNIDQSSNTWRMRSGALGYSTKTGTAFVWVEGWHPVTETAGLRTENPEIGANFSIDLVQFCVVAANAVSDSRDKQIERNLFYLSAMYGLRKPILGADRFHDASLEDHNWVSSVLRRLKSGTK